MVIGRGPGARGGLRERKKLAVRRALSSAAIRLAAEQGLAKVTIEGITAEADVSVRTFGNYFSSKYEAICALGMDRARRIGAELLARPTREPLWQALVNAMLAHYEDADQAPDREWLASLKLVLTAPAIRSEYLKVDSAMQETLAGAIAARTGMDVERDMYPQVLAGAVTAAAQVAVRRWAAAADPHVQLRPLLRSALDELAAACPGGADRYLTEEEFKALVRPALLGPNGPLCEPPGKPVQLPEAGLLVAPSALLTSTMWAGQTWTGPASPPSRARRIGLVHRAPTPRPLSHQPYAWPAADPVPSVPDHRASAVSRHAAPDRPWSCRSSCPAFPRKRLVHCFTKRFRVPRRLAGVDGAGGTRPPR